MKYPCCALLVAIMIFIVGLQLWTLYIIRHPSLGSPTPAPTYVPSLAPTQPTPTTTPTPTPTPSSDSTLLFKRDNPGACSFTTHAPFTIKEPHVITKFQTWYSWGSNEITLDYKLLRGETLVREGVLLRKDCDPYQRQWCQAVEENLTLNLEPGDYTLVADTEKICQNSTSGGDGFIFVYGR